MQKVKAPVLVLFILLGVIGIMESIRMSGDIEELTDEKQKLSKEVKNLEEDLEHHTETSKELEKKNKWLTEEVSELDKEIEALKTPVDYQDVLDGIKLVESYKSVKEFKGIIEGDLFSGEIEAGGLGIGFSSLEGAGNCPCSISFGQRSNNSIIWTPNSVLELEKIRTEKEKIFLTYKTVPEIENNYQFVLTKARGRDDRIEKWRIEDINLQKK